MDALGLKTPDSLFETAKAALATLAPIVGAVDKFGTTATLGELTTGATRAAVATEITIAGAAVLASGYAGAVLGSIFVATIYTEKCDTKSMPRTRGQMGRKHRVARFNVLDFGKENGVYAKWFEPILTKHPEIFDDEVVSKTHRRNFIQKNKRVTYG